MNAPKEIWLDPHDVKDFEHKQVCDAINYIRADVVEEMRDALYIISNSLYAGIGFNAGHMRTLAKGVLERAEKDDE